MKPISMHSIVTEINMRSRNHPIGKLQEIRRDMKGLKQITPHNIFLPATTHEEWAFHYGGRKELQFNVGLETIDGSKELRYGVAFSFETSQSLPNITDLKPRVDLFNEYLKLHPGHFTDMSMWYWVKDIRSAEFKPIPIPSELANKGVFIFLGKRQPLYRMDYEIILSTFDQLLPLYIYTLGHGSKQTNEERHQGKFNFHPGVKEKKSYTSVSLPQRDLDIYLRHNILQKELCRQLIKEYGIDNVRAEQPSGAGTNIDIVVQHGDKYNFFEIKTASSPRACIREALGQILEYAYWHGIQDAERLVIVGESALDQQAAMYLRTLQERFSLPIDYEQIVLKK